VHGRLVAGLVVAALLAAAPAAAVVPGGNLVVNPGAEAGAGAPDSVQQLPLPGWTVESTFTAVQYGTPAFLTAADSAALGGGLNFFAGGNSAASAATQLVDVSVAASEIDAGNVTATLAALLGGYSSQADHATVTATFLNAAGAPAGTLALPTVTPAERNLTTTLLPRTASAAVPAGTRQISVRMDAIRDDGSYNDGYIDNVSLVLGSGGGPPVFHKSVGVKLVSGQVGIRRPGSRKDVDLKGSDTIPLGSTVDAEHGALMLSAVPRAGAAPQTAKFYEGVFKVTQSGGTTQLALTQPLAPCRGRAAGVAAKRKPSRRHLWGDGKGAFRTSGKYSSATVRGTKWLVRDSCAGTLTRVVRGTVTVRDNVRHETITVPAGRSYLARPR
jgi:hypothetical protein